MNTYRNVLSTRQTPQSQPIPGTSQVQNNAGGYAWQIDDWKRLDRFIILGSEAGTYYVNERKLTLDNAQAVMRCVQKDGPRVADRAGEISEAGRAPKNDPALFVLAMCAGAKDADTRRAAFENLQKVARTGTHLLHFLEYVQGFRGWGRGLRRAVADWYNAKPAKDLAYQAIKYQSRDRWAQRDALRLAHPQPLDAAHNAIYKWIVDGVPEDFIGWSESLPEGTGTIHAFEMVKRCQNMNQVAKLIHDWRLPREAVPTEWLKEPKVWEALLESMPMTAMIRNLATMTRIGLLKPMSDATVEIVKRLEAVGKARVHPLQVLVALKTYEGGHGVARATAVGYHSRGAVRTEDVNTWKPVPQIVDALDSAFYAAFGNVEPTGKAWLLGLDVSGSMGWGEIAGMPGITPRVGAAAMAMVTARTEQKWAVMGFSHHLVPISISPRQRLDDVIKTVSAIPMGGTDCALPILYALQEGLHVDVFATYTDNETWAGNIHPAQALRMYRDKTGVDAKLIVVGMTSAEFSIADPDDRGMMDVVGFDTAAPEIMRDFALE